MNDSIDEHTAFQLCEALDEGRLDSLFQAGHLNYAERDGFAGTTLSLGVPRESVLHLLGSVRRAQGLTILAGAWGDYSGWITLSAEVVELLHWIDIRARFDFESATNLPDDEIRRLRNQILIEEVLPLGLTTGEASPASGGDPSSAAMNAARRMLQEGTEPASDYEQRVLRFFELMRRLPELAAQPLTVDRLRDLHAMIVLDESVGGVYRTEAHEAEPSADGPGALPERIPGEMKAIAAYGSENHKPFIHPLIKTIVYFYWIRRVQPFLADNGLFARLVAHIYEYQQGYRQLPFTPLTRTQSSEWAAPPPDVGEPRFDATGFVIKRLNLFLNAYIEAEREIDRATRQYASLNTRFQVLDVNHRQARILDDALSAPTTVFTIRRHERSRGLAYETARQDFLQLVAAGYLEQSKRGRVFEFRLAKGAERKLVHFLSA